MKQFALTQAAINMVAADPKNHPELRAWLSKARKERDKAVRNHAALVAKMDGLIDRLALALGEVGA